MGARCTLPGLTEVFLHHMAHHVRLERGLTFGLNPKPGLRAWGITDVLHAGSTWKRGEGAQRLRRQTGAARACVRHPNTPSTLTLAIGNTPLGEFALSTFHARSGHKRVISIL